MLDYENRSGCVQLIVWGAISAHVYTAMNSGVADGPKRVRQTSRKLRQVRATTPPTIPEEEDYPTALRTYSLYEDDYGLGHGRGRGATEYAFIVF